MDQRGLPGSPNRVRAKLRGCRPAAPSGPFSGRAGRPSNPQALVSPGAIGDDAGHLHQLLSGPGGVAPGGNGDPILYRSYFYYDSFGGVSERAGGPRRMAGGGARVRGGDDHAPARRRGVRSRRLSGAVRGALLCGGGGDHSAHGRHGKRHFHGLLSDRPLSGLYLSDRACSGRRQLRRR